MKVVLNSKIVCKGELLMGMRNIKTAIAVQVDDKPSIIFHYTGPFLHKIMR